MSQEQPKLTGKQLKAQRREAKVSAKVAAQPAETGSSNAQAVTLKPPGQVKSDGKPAAQKKVLKNASPSADDENPTPERIKAVSLFSHLDQKRALTSEHIPRDVHPATVALALRYSSGLCIGSNSRCIAMLRTFQKVISDYTVPITLQTSLQRHLPTYLSSQISYLVSARPLSVSMGAAIRLLKQEISTTDLEASEETNKERLLQFIDTFIKERIEIAGQVIVKAAEQRVDNGDTILVYAHSTIVEKILLHAAKTTRFKVIVVDSRPKLEGRTMLERLSKAGIDCTYILLTAIGYVIGTVNKVFLGAHTVLANGAVYSRAGTALIAMTATEYHVPVIVACETYKFSDRVQLDSFVTNELGLTSDLDLCLSDQSAREPLVEKNASKDNKQTKDVKDVKGKATQVKAGDAAPKTATTEMKKSSQLLRLNLMYDVTPERFVTMCISELGSLPTTAIPFAALSEQNGA